MQNMQLFRFNEKDRGRKVNRKKKTSDNQVRLKSCFECHQMRYGGASPIRAGEGELECSQMPG